jgi:hypothetical protein
LTPPAAEPGSLQPSDVEQLRWLTIFYYVTTALFGLVGCFPLIHLTVGLFMLFGPSNTGNTGPAPQLVGGIFIAAAVVIMAVAWSLAACQLAVARALDRRRRHTFCVVVAAVTAATCVPLGTALGVFTLLVLMRPQVKAAFGRPA